MEKERKEKRKSLRKFDMVKLESLAWTIDVPLRKKMMEEDPYINDLYQYWRDQRFI